MVNAVSASNSPLTAPGVHNIGAPHRVQNNENTAANAVRRIVHPTQHLHVISDAPQNFIRSTRVAEAEGTYREGNPADAREAVAALNAQNAQSFVEQHLMRLAEDYPQTQAAQPAQQPVEAAEPVETVAEAVNSSAEVVSVPRAMAENPPQLMQVAQGDVVQQQVGAAANEDGIDDVGVAMQQAAQPPPLQQQATQPQQQAQQTQQTAPQQDVQRQQAAQQESVQRQAAAAEQPQQRAQQPQTVQEDVQRQASVTGAAATPVVI